MVTLSAVLRCLLLVLFVFGVNLVLVVAVGVPVCMVLAARDARRARRGMKALREETGE